MRSVTILAVICGLTVTGIVVQSAAHSAVASGHAVADRHAVGAGHSVAGGQSPGTGQSLGTGQQPGGGPSTGGGQSTGGGLSTGADQQPAAGLGQGDSSVIHFGGYAIEVPAGWPVYWLARDPSRCVRYDRHAVYLGDPGAEQRCPAHLVGRVATISLQLSSSGMRPAAGLWRPVGKRARSQSTRSRFFAGPLQAGASVWVAPETGQAMAVFQRGLSGLTLSATYGADARQVGRIIRSVRWAGPVESAATRPAGAPPAAAAWHAVRAHAVRLLHQARSRVRHHHARHHHHRRHRRHHRHHPARKGFDTCATPSLRVMRKWHRAFRDVAVYIGGPEAACGWGNLSRRWIRVATRMGWGVLPTYVGRQAPCTRFRVRIRPGRAERQGRAAARAAVRLAHALHIRRHAPIYDDMEAYRHRRARCRRPVLAFLDGWTRALHRHGYRSGVYSSAGAAATDLGRSRTVYGHRIAKPSSYWFGLWDRHGDLSGTPYVRVSWWRGGHRVKQYRGPHRRRINGVRLEIDSDLVAGAVYR